MKKNFHFFIIIFVFLYGCLDNESSNPKNGLFNLPTLTSPLDENLTLYSNKPFDIVINYSAPCGYKEINIKFDLGNFLLVNSPEKNSISGKITLKVLPKNPGKGNLEISLIDNCNEKSFLNFNLSIQESIGYSGLLANYTFSLNAEDKSGKENHGEVYGATLTTDRHGKKNSAYSFDGQNDYIIISNDFFNIGSDYYTISGWFYTDKINIQNQNIFNTTPSYGISLNWNKQESPFVVSFSLNNNPSIKLWNIVFANGVLASVGEKKWHHFLFSKNNNIWSLYIDGVGNSFIWNLPPVEKKSGIVFGKNISTKSGNLYFKGKLDDFYFFERTLNADEVTFLREN